MSRRSFLLGGLAGAGLGLLSGSTERPLRVHRIGFLSPGPQEGASVFTEPFLQGLRELGYVEGVNINIEYRWADTDDQFHQLAAELVELNLDVIVTRAAPAAVAAKEATATIPIVAAAVADPVAIGLVASLGRPGGNVTGLSTLGAGSDTKRLELLKETLPSAARVGVLLNPSNPQHGPRLQQLRPAAEALGLQLDELVARGPDDFIAAFAAATTRGIDALIAPSDAVLLNFRARIVELAAQHRLPVVYEHREFPDAGGLLSYGPDFPELFRRTATYVDKILRGTRPADLPVEQPTKFGLVVNLGAARALGLTIPDAVLMQATEVIQ